MQNRGPRGECARPQHLQLRTACRLAAQAENSTITVKTEISPAITVTAPSNVDFLAQGPQSGPTAKDFYLGVDSNVPFKVTLTSANPDGSNGFQMLNQTNTTTKLAYTITGPDGSGPNTGNTQWVSGSTGAVDFPIGNYTASANGLLTFSVAYSGAGNNAAYPSATYHAPSSGRIGSSRPRSRVVRGRGRTRQRLPLFTSNRAARGARSYGFRHGHEPERRAAAR
jgi:hypothetical protein